VGESRPASNASKVDLPAPDEPTTATDSPAAMSNETSCTIVKGPSGLATCFVRFSALRTLSRLINAWALCIGLVLFAVQDASAAQQDTILVLGDSLSAAYGLRPEQGWVTLLQKRLETQGYGYTVANASVSGETTSGGLQRLPRALSLHKPSIVVLELGGNDGLRGLPVATTRQNLTRMIELAKQSGAQVLLIGIRMPPNYGPRFTEQFNRTYGELAKSYDLKLVPFLLERLALNPQALDPKLLQQDGIHPTGPAQPLLLETVWPQLQPLLKHK
jgi:acyl-CoA thioesterase-1